MKRRQLLQTLAIAPFATLAGRLYAAPPDSPRFLLVFLRGGYDCLNVLVPYASNFYYESRPNIAIAKPSSGSSLVLDADWALNPALEPTLAGMYARREIAFVPFAGTDDLSRSHFETQDNIELGQPAEIQGAGRDLRSGFMSRLAQTITGAKAISFTDSLPACFRGDPGVPNISLRTVDKPVFDERQASLLSDLYAGHALQGSVREGLELRQHVSVAEAEEMSQANRGAISAKGFELEAQRIGRLLRSDFGLGFVDIGGWDTHVNENAALAGNLDSVGRGLQALAKELGDTWRNTVVVVVSEFGRTFRENGNRGTDHGHGSVYWVAGGAIAGGRVAGRQQQLTQATLFQNRDLPVLNDYRALLGGVLRATWQLSPPQLAQVFPGATPLELGLI